MTLSVPYSFVPGTKAKAGEVNANFISVLNDIENLNSRFITESERLSNSITDLENEKLKIDFSNISESADTVINEKIQTYLSIVPNLAQAINNAGYKVIIETYQQGNSWYRIWSDGFCEQGGQLETAAGNEIHGTQLNFLKEYSNTNYCINATIVYSPSIENFWSVNIVTGAKTTSSIRIYTGDLTIQGPRANTVNWVTMGYLAEGEY